MPYDSHGWNAGGKGKRMSQFEMLPGEVELGTWTLNYLPPGGGRFTGPLTVTDQRLLFKATFDTSSLGVLRELIIYKDTHGYLVIPKNRIKDVARKSSLLKKQVRVILDDGEVHTFDYGMLSVDKLAAAVETRKA
jgi:hypothetical protein